MQEFLMDPSMTTIQGVFYPTGYAFLMFPDFESAENAAHELESLGFAGQDVMVLTPHQVLRDIGQIKNDSTVPLPSVGTEGATVQKYIDFARDGHHALMVKASSSDDTERMMSVIRKYPFSYGQKYHMLAMEDLE